MTALALDLEVLAHVVDPQQAVNEQRFTGEPTDDSRGDAEAALAAAEVTVELSISRRRRSCSLRSSRTRLSPRGTAIELTAWVSTQGMFAARDELATAFGLRKDDVRVRTEFVGGGFGGKQGAGFEALAAAELSRITGRPVRLVNDRHAEQLDGGRRCGDAADRTGSARRATARSPRSTPTRCVAMGQGGWALPVLSPARTLYRCADVRALSFPARTNLRAQNAFRAPGVMEGTTAFEQAMDELALALEHRSARAAPPQPRRRRPGQRPAVLEQAAARLLRPRRRARRLGRARASCGRRSGDGLLRGMGCATQIWWGGGGPPSHATVRLDADGHAAVVTGIQDIGTGTLTGAQIVAAEELGLPLDHVRVVGGDTRPERLRARSPAARRRRRR